MNAFEFMMMDNVETGLFFAILLGAFVGILVGFRGSFQKKQPGETYTPIDISALNKIVSKHTNEKIKVNEQVRPNATALALVALAREIEELKEKDE